MNRVAECFARLRAGGKKGLIAYLTAGYPNPEICEALAVEVAGRGVDMLEIGIPFSDPMADGPTIQRASQAALAAGITLDRVFKIAEAIRKRVSIPLLFMTYYNPVLQAGLESFTDHCRSVGVNGLIVPDLTPEEGEGLETAAADRELGMVYLIAPTSTPARIRLASDHTTAFLYCVAYAGITGRPDAGTRETASLVSRARRITDKPLAVGFGVTAAAQAGRIATFADGVIVGSAILRDMEKHPKNPAKVGDYVEGLVRAVKGSGSGTRDPGLGS